MIAGKMFTKIILNRISEVIEALLRENKCGFRTKAGCCDQIFTLRQIIEKSLEFNNNLYICFVDLKNRKAPGLDGIQAEIYKYGGETVFKWLHRVIQACWNSEEIPEDCRKMVLTPLHK